MTTNDFIGRVLGRPGTWFTLSLSLLVVIFYMVGWTFNPTVAYQNATNLKGLDAVWFAIAIASAIACLSNWVAIQNEQLKEEIKQKALKDHFAKYGVEQLSHLKLTGDELKIVLGKLNPSDASKKYIHELGTAQGYLTIKDIENAIEKTELYERDAGFLQALKEIEPENVKMINREE